MKNAAVIAILATFLFCSAAGAYPVSVGDTIFITSSGPLGGGGEIAVVNQTNGFRFESFCLEREEIILQGSKNPYVVYDVSPYAMSGGGGAVNGKDELSAGTKWLYYNYWTGVLASEYGYNGVGSKKGQGALQLAIWYMEGETDGLVEKDGDGKKWDGRYFYELAMQHEKEGALLPVYAMNIWGPYRQGAAMGEGQSMLVVTPEPWTLLLLGTGLVGLAGLRRKNRTWAAYTADARRRVFLPAAFFVCRRMQGICCIWPRGEKRGSHRLPRFIGPCRDDKCE